MHVGGLTLDLNWLLQFIFTAFVIAFCLLRLVRNTASKYFEVDSSFDGNGDRNRLIHGVVSMDADDLSCVNCGEHGSKKCSGCKSVRYCSSKCQAEHWRSGHKFKCKDYGKTTQISKTKSGAKPSCALGRSSSGIALIPASGTSRPTKKPRKVLFPYDEFIKLYNWEKPEFPPCGLLNCGNSCFANVVLQCLTYTRPLVAFLLEKGHRKECSRNDWCFLCEFESHVERACQSSQSFSPINILSHLPNIGGNLGHGRQEDAHEFMRFAIDRMQSVCLDEFGGEKAVSPTSQETTLIQHIFGGQLQSQVVCTKCNKISNQFENIMDLTVEIHGDALLEECLDQFTATEWLHGDNMYKCDGCNDYVKASKRLTIRRAPNILTIALKRFQSGRFGKLNKRVTFPETLDLSPYMSEECDGTDVYNLYAVVVHVDMLNASFFGHYICYTKDFKGNWYRIDDCKVARVEIEEVLSQSAYMLLYSRASVRSSCPRATEPPEEQTSPEKMDPELSTNGARKCSSPLTLNNNGTVSEPQASESDGEVVIEHSDIGMANPVSNSIDFKESTSHVNKSTARIESEATRDSKRSGTIVPILHSNSDEEETSVASNCNGSPVTADKIELDSSLPVSMEISDCEGDPCNTVNGNSAMVEELCNMDMVNNTETDDEGRRYRKMNGSVRAF